MNTAGARPIALVTGAGRVAGINATVVDALATDGWDIATTHVAPDVPRSRSRSRADEPVAILERAAAAGARTATIAADLADPTAAERIFDHVESSLGGVTALVLGHAVSIDSDIRTTTVDSFDRHIAINARAGWQLVREFGLRYRGGHGTGRIVALTSDHTVENIPYGASKAALDRIVLAAARELGELGITANAVNPGPVDTGWMSDEVRERVRRRTPLGRIGGTDDAARIVRFLCSAEGGWINGQLIRSDGGFSAP